LYTVDTCVISHVYKHQAPCSQSFS